MIQIQGATVREAKHLFVETEGYFLEGFVYDRERLLITFEFAGAPFERPDGYRLGWASRPLRNRGISHLCIKPKRVDWYRGADLHQALAALARKRFFRQFRRVITYGGSMGGFGAMVFADLVGAHTVLALNPQTTLDLNKVPGENRFPKAQEQSWSGPFSDVADELSDRAELIVAVDRCFRPDWRHLTRLRPEVLSKATILNMPYLGHSIPAHMQALGVLAPVLNGVLEDRLETGAFYARLRERRRLKRYFNRLGNQARVQRSALFSEIVARHRALSPLQGMD